MLQLNKYDDIYHPEYWIFNGQDGGKYADRSVQKILRNSVEASKVYPFMRLYIQ
jgi:integrase/recombinase XerD